MEGNVLGRYVGAFVDELCQNGVGHAVVCPGSRSTPLAMALAANDSMKVWMHIDERSAAFFALGIAKTLRRPVAVVCTSGSAAANFYPAVVEAHEARVPLVVLTADRPHELRDVGAPQAIDQLRFFGTYVKWFAEMALPEANAEMIRYVRTAAVRAASTAAAVPSGPVHLNFPFREPLVPEWPTTVKETTTRTQAAVNDGSKAPDAETVKRLVEQWVNVEKGLIVCGQQDDPRFPTAVVQLAETLGYPILADPLSQLRSGTHNKHIIVDGYDAFLRDERLGDKLRPELVIRFGAMPVSKALMLYLKKCAGAGTRVIFVEEDGWRDPIQSVSEWMRSRPVSFCDALVSELESAGERLSMWTEEWLQINSVTRRTLIEQGRSERLSEGQIFLEVAALMPDDALLFAGNSMPVRDLDTFFVNTDQPLRTMANRGANGIDGIVSTALGASAVSDPVVLVVGDLSFYHDLNGLLAAKLHRLNLTIIVVNNNGGGIFSFLPQAESVDSFETLFGTPTDLSFAKAVDMYGGTYAKVENWRQFRDRFTKSVACSGLSVIEVQTNRSENVEVHRRLWSKVAEAVAARQPVHRR
ncbi:MAG TPA: 2-succinyl-5-enolpyruvyl-6-hydroxy-3-cyclohexene-1-carboxylic-acid synthase [Bacillales bacterium]|nr:2-succinyl-5-enolpyruvyl-6-hydroxy-3-cyclohexene-1-carboxylic-acid synthase [Bacillales bacterium]